VVRNLERGHGKGGGRVRGDWGEGGRGIRGGGLS
jgi:hypothetical protein